MKRRIVIVGSYPPPYGGISVHIQRACEEFSRDYEIEVLDFYQSVENPGRESFVHYCGNQKPFNLLKALAFLGKKKAHLYHFHVSAMSNFVFAGYLLLLSLGRNVNKIITIHSGSFVSNYERASFVKKALIKRLIEKFDHIINVNEEGMVLLKNVGIPEEKMSVVPAFLPPVLENSEQIAETIRGLRQKVKKIFLVSGCALSYYGFHLLLDSLDQYGEEKKDFGVVFAFYRTYDEQYVLELERRLKGHYNYAILNDLNPNQFSFLISLVDIYVRPTDRDGDAVSLREAAFFGKQILASDCIKRPSDVLLFETMNSDSLKKVLDVAIEDEEKGRAQFDYYENMNRLSGIYKRMSFPEHGL